MLYQPKKFEYSKDGHPHMYEPPEVVEKDSYTYDEFMKL